MHDYAVFNHDRTQIGRWLGVASITGAGAIANFSSLISPFTGLGSVLEASLGTGVIYFLLHLLYSKFVWKLPFNKIPNLNGKWKAEGKTLSEDGSKPKYEWPALIEIEQNWKQIVIRLSTKQSQSESYTATMSKRTGPSGGWLLSYSYKNEPEVEHAFELNKHQGFCEIQFNDDMSIGKAAYFNNNGRRTFGSMKLIKVDEK